MQLQRWSCLHYLINGLITSMLLNEYIVKKLHYIWPWFIYTVGMPMSMVYSYYHTWPYWSSILYTYVHAWCYILMWEYQSYVNSLSLHPCPFTKTHFWSTLMLSLDNIDILMLHCLSLSPLFQVCGISATDHVPWGCKCQASFSIHDPKLTACCYDFSSDSHNGNEFVFMHFST